MTEETNATYITATAEMLGLEIAANHRAGVEQFFALAKDMAASLEKASLPANDADLAPILCLPVTPDSGETA